MKKDLLYKLGEAKLKRPKGLRKFVADVHRKIPNYHRRTCYINTLEMWHDRLLMRTFAFAKDRKYNDPIQEICRRLEGEKEVLLCQVESCYMSGRTVNYTETGRWITNKERSCYYSWYRGDKNHWWFYGTDMFNVDEWIERLGIRYCGYNSLNYKNRMSFIHYVDIYRKYPKVELLAKAGWGQLISSARYFNFNGKSFEQIFKIPKCWKEHMQQLEMRDILLIRKYHVTIPEELSVIKEVDARKAKYIIKYRSHKLLNYIRSNNVRLPEYNDYLRMAEGMGYPMDRKDVLFPKEFTEAHNILQSQYKQVKSEIVNKGIKAMADKLMKYQYESGGFVIVPARSNEELIAESEALNHCVRTYAEKVAKGETGIMFVRKQSDPDEPFVTLELKGRKVIQVRAKNNSIPIPKVCDVVRDWEKRFRLSGW